MYEKPQQRKIRKRGRRGKRKRGKRKEWMLRKQETLQRIKEEKRKTDEKQHPHRHLDDREGVGMTITGTEVSVQTVDNIVSHVLHLLDDILIAAGEDEAGEVEGIETEDDGSRGGGY